MQDIDFACNEITFRSRKGENGYDIRTVQELVGHSDVRTTMIYGEAITS